MNPWGFMVMAFGLIIAWVGVRGTQGTLFADVTGHQYQRGPNSIPNGSNSGGNSPSGPGQSPGNFGANIPGLPGYTPYLPPGIPKIDVPNPLGGVLTV